MSVFINGLQKVLLKKILSYYMDQVTLEKVVLFVILEILFLGEKLLTQIQVLDMKTFLKNL